MLSRTYSTRPEWVKLNDPKFPSKERHDHVVIKREKTGRMTTHTRHKWVGGEWPYTVEETYEVPEYHTWSEIVPCDIDKPERPWRENRKTWGTDDEKHCDKRPLYRNGCPCCTHSYAKRLYTKSQRAGINQQLHNAVRDNGWTADPNEWYDVDITAVGIAEDWKFWD